MRQKLDEVLGGEAASGALRKIVLREVKTIQEREKSITLSALIDDTRRSSIGHIARRTTSSNSEI
ncbi:MAG TPA: hypothetical protein VIS99_05715 [Terrimicrobiaceae bacterium]